MAKLGFKGTFDYALACIEAGTVPAVVGAPGIGKTSMARELSEKLSLTLAPVVGGTIMDDDIPGTPWVNPRTGQLDQAHRGPFKTAIDGPALLLLDEFTCTPEVSHAAALALLLDRRAGDKQLHEDTRIMVLYNPPAQAPGGMRLSAATANRMVTVEMEPTVKEVANWFQARESVILAEFGAFCAHDPDLLQLVPGPQDIEAGRTWASPRGWELGLRAFEAHAVRNNLGLVGGREDAVAHALICGAVGGAAAGKYFAAREQRRHLPPFDQILADPAGTADKLPNDAHVQVAGVSILPALAKNDTGAAWVFAKGLYGRYRGAACAVLMGRGGVWVDGPHARDGRKAQTQLVASAVKDLPSK